MKTFNINTQTYTPDNFDFRGAQANRAAAVQAARVFEWRYIAGNVKNLPKYILNAIRENGYTAHHLGGTTFEYSVIGLAKTTIRDERKALDSIWWCIQNAAAIGKRLEMAVRLFPELKNEYAPRLVALHIEASI